MHLWCLFKNHRYITHTHNTFTQRPRKPCYTDTLTPAHTLPHTHTLWVTLFFGSLFCASLCIAIFFSVLTHLSDMCCPTNNKSFSLAVVLTGSFSKPPLVGMEESPGRCIQFEKACPPHLYFHPAPITPSLAVIWCNFLAWFFSLTPIEKLMDIQHLVLSSVWWEILTLWFATLCSCSVELSVVTELYRMLSSMVATATYGHWLL